MIAMVASLLLLLVNALAPAPAETGAQPQPDPGVTGYVLAPDGTPVSGGTVIAQSGMISARAAIDSTGRFRVVPLRSGLQQFIVNVPGLAPYRVDVSVPASRSLRLPIVRLQSGAYYRVRLVTAGGEAIIGTQLRRRLFAAGGTQIFAPLDDRASSLTDNDGITTIGPLPRGLMTLAVDMPLFARTRLPDVNLGDATTTVQTFVIQQPGSVLHVDVVDGTGAHVSNHEVHIEDVRPRSPLVLPPLFTNQQGRATFDRLAAGRYRVSSIAPDRCAGVYLTTWRLVPVPSNGTVETPLVVGGRATFHVTSPLGPAVAVLVSASPAGPAAPSPLAARALSFGCRGATDRDGRVTLTNFPPGPAWVLVQMANSTYIRNVDVPLDGREIAIAIPEGLLPARVVNQKNEPVAGAAITWTGSGGRVEATATVTGDALLEGVGIAAGTLSVSARGYEPAEEPFAEPPAVLHTVALTPAPRPVAVSARVMTTMQEPLPRAVVELLSKDPSVVPRVAVTDAKGLVTFADVPGGSLQLIASADGFVTSAMGVASEAPGEVQFMLSHGYRLVAKVELPTTAGSQLVHVMNDGNASMDDILDAESDRRVEPPGRLSLGPLAPGAYVIELKGGGERRQERVRIIDRDVSTTIR